MMYMIPGIAVALILVLSRMVVSLLSQKIAQPDGGCRFWGGFQNSAGGSLLASYTKSYHQFKRDYGWYRAGACLIVRASNPRDISDGQLGFHYM
jgi:hypothetical protein